MKCQSLFSGKNKKRISHLLSSELAQGVVKLNGLGLRRKLVMTPYGMHEHQCHGSTRQTDK